MTGPALDGVGFSLRVPDSWFRLEVDPRTRRAALEELVTRQVREVPQLRAHRTTVARIVREQAQQAWDSGVAFCACLVEPTEDGPVVASVTVSVLSALTGVGSTGTDRLVALAAPFTPQVGLGGAGCWREVSTVDVPGVGPAVRARGVQDVALPEDTGVLRVVLLQTIAPLPRSRALLVTCSSPVLALTEALLDVFDAVSGTLQVVLPPGAGAEAGRASA